MTMETTASGNFDNKKSWSGLRKHMEHDPNIQHENEFLNTEESKQLRKYNTHKVLIDYDDFTEKAFGSFVKEHDTHMIDKTRKFGSVKRFLRVNDRGQLRSTQPAQAYMEKLSNKYDWHDFRDKLIKRLQHYKWTSGSKKGQFLTADEAKNVAYITIAKGLEKYADGFNERNPNLKMFEYYTHLDEEGAPHLHAKVMPFVQPQGLTKKGRMKKPSFSLNTALATQYKRKRYNKANLHKFREQEDNALINSMNAELEKRLGIKEAFKLIRKTEIDESLETGLDHDVYKAKASEIHKLEQQKQKNEQKIAEQSKTLNNQAKTLAENKPKLDNLANYDSLVSSAKTTLADIQNQKDEAENAKNDALKAQREAEKARQKALKDAQLANANYLAQLNARKEEQERHKKELEDREKALNARINGFTDNNGIYHKGIKDRENDLNKRKAIIDSQERVVRSQQKSLQNYDAKINDKKKELTTYTNGLEKKKKKILANQNADLKRKYVANKQAYDNQLNALKARNNTASKFMTYASFIYHDCAEVFIKNLDPSTNTLYNNGFKQSKNTMAFDLAHGKYHNLDDIGFGGGSSLDNCIYYAKANKPRLWQAIKATSKHFAKLVNTTNVKKLVAKLDKVDENGLTATAVNQATQSDMQKEQQRQQELENAHKKKIEKIKNTQVHVAPRIPKNEIDNLDF